MALQKAKPKDLPSDAIRLSEAEALDYQLKVLRNWENTSDILIFKYGVPILAGASILTGVYMNRYFRRKYKLLNYGSVATYLPACIVPTVTSAVFHMQFVVSDVVLFKTNCPVCVEIRASSLQALTGGILPFFMGNVGCLAVAARYSTYNVPYITQEPMKVLKLVQAMGKPLVNILIAICIGHALLASTVTYFEAKAVYTVQKKLIQQSEELS